ncbi:MAG: amidohydrolase [Gemmatimonadaceae bacterium]|nr:amidohydrolase [Gemmatimonadaceae bacterium]
MKTKGTETRVVDLGGRTLTPGFIDGHAHVAQFGVQAVGGNLLAAPDGNVATIAQLVTEMKRAAATMDTSYTGWIFGSGYDDAILGRHPTAADLDKVSTTIPVAVIHISGHFSAVNSAGLKRIGYTAATADPAGGIIRRKPGSREPNGVLEETAHFAYLFGAVGPRNQAVADTFLLKGLELAKSHGHTTANEGRAVAAQHNMFLSAAKRGLLDIDVVSYIDYTERKLIDSVGLDARKPATYSGRYRVAGMKITVDGSPQGRTAWRTVPYLLPPDGQKAGYMGYAAIPDEKLLTSLFDSAYAKHWPVKVHANGDAAVDQFIRVASPAARRHPEADLRHVLIHGQFVRDDQLDSLRKYKLFPSLFPMHTFYWGDWYGKIVGDSQAQRISPMRNVLDRGMMTTSHTDAPVALPNLLQVMWATVNRVTRSGKVLGPDQRVTPLEAFKMFTIWGAYQHHEEKTKGSIEVGKLADFVILSDNPLTIEPMKINTIVVQETIKDGRTVWTRKAPAVAAR